MASTNDNTTTSLRIYAQISSQYSVLDKSGELPFTVILGLLRRSQRDTDPRTLFLATADSALDIPYALAHGLIELQEEVSDEPNRWNTLDLGFLDQNIPQSQDYFALPSPVPKKPNRLWDHIEHHYRVDPASELASVLKLGKHYRLRFASHDLQVKQWAYGDRNPFLDNSVALVSSREPSHLTFAAHGHACITPAERLSWPPTVRTQLRWHRPSTSPLPSPDVPSLEQSNAATDTAVLLEISATNTGPDAVTVQTNGHQRHSLVPVNCMQQAQPGDDDGGPRVLHLSPHVRTASSVRIIAAATGVVVREYRPPACRGLTTGKPDLRPRARDLVLLPPGEPVVRTLDIAVYLLRLADGDYRVRMDARPCQWWDGKAQVGEDGRLLRTLYKQQARPPLWLKSSDEVMLRICGGKVVEKF